MKLEEFKKLSPYPFIFDSELYDGKKLKQNNSCTGCNRMECLKDENYNGNSHYKCYKGLRSFQIFTNNGNNFTLNGLLFEQDFDKVLRQYKEEYNVEEEEISNFIDLINSFEEVIEERIVNTIEENFSVFHDIKTTAITVTNCAESLINKNEGSNFEEKLHNSSTELFDLYNSISLLSDHLGMIDILVNTNKIRYAKKRQINIYQLFERFSRLLQTNASKKDLKIQWHDNGKISDLLLYPSIQFLPLILIDNAIKYSFHDKTIVLGFYENDKKIEIKITSYGNFVPDNEIDKIFDKYYRGENSTDKEGIGMGLWIADRICKAHNGSIEYEQNGTEDFGQNIFKVTIPKLN